MKKTLMDKARIMLSGARIAQELWVEAVDTKKYLVNMSPSSALVDTTPHEVWSSKKPSVSHLKVFGCDAFVHVPKEKMSKLDKKTVKYIFIGYNEGMKGYKLWDPTSRKQCAIEIWSSEKLEVSLSPRKLFRLRIILRWCGLK
jgi:hypothetical protein